MDWGEPGQTAAADDQIITRDPNPSISRHKNFQAQRRLSEQKRVRTEEN